MSLKSKHFLTSGLDLRALRHSWASVRLGGVILGGQGLPGPRPVRIIWCQWPEKHSYQASSPKKFYSWILLNFMNKSSKIEDWVFYDVKIILK